MAAFVPAVATAIFLIIGCLANPRTTGQFLYVVLVGWGLFQVMVMPGDLPTDALGEERRNGTLGLLYLTGLSSFELFGAHLAGGFLIAMNRLLALAPLLLVPSMMHAVPLSGYAAALEVLLCWALFSLGTRVFAASVFADGSAAELFSQGCLLLLGAGMHILGALNQLLAGTRLSRAWLQFSPGYAVVSLFTGLGHVRPSEILFSNLAAATCGILFFASAGVLLRRSWQDQVFGRTGNGWSDWMSRLRREHRRKVGARWLDVAPYAWLAARFTAAYRVPIISLSIMAVLWLIGLSVWQRFWLIPVSLWLTALLVAVMVRWSLHYSISRQITEDRNSGALELLLTTPLTPEEIVAGEDQLRKRHSRPIFCAVAVFYGILFCLGAAVLNGGMLALASYTCIWIAVCCLGPWMNPSALWSTFWVCLNLGRPAFALKKFLWQGSGTVSVGVQMVINAVKLKPIPYGTPLEFGICSGIAVLMVVVVFTSKRAQARLRIREKILEDFREIAGEPVPEKDDPRLKSWVIHQRFFKPEPEKIVV